MIAPRWRDTDADDRALLVLAAITLGLCALWSDGVWRAGMLVGAGYCVGLLRAVMGGVR